MSGLALDDPLFGLDDPNVGLDDQFARDIYISYLSDTRLTVAGRSHVNGTAKMIITATGAAQPSNDEFDESELSVDVVVDNVLAITDTSGVSGDFTAWVQLISGSERTTQSVSGFTPMPINSDIEIALIQQLQGVGLTPIQYPNTKINPEAGQTFAVCHLLSRPTRMATIGSDGRNICEGIFQVNVHAPKWEGRSTWIDAISTAFIRQTLLYGTISLYITEVRVASPIDDEPYYVTPIDINFTAYD